MELNPLLLTDSYKFQHMSQYPESTEFIYSYLEARRPDLAVMMFGLNYYLRSYLSTKITFAHVEEALEVRHGILGSVSDDVVAKYRSLAELQYFPLSIRAIPEGMIVPTKTPLLSIINTIPGYGWCGGYLESLLLKLWNTCTVATTSAKYRMLVESYAWKTCENLDHIPFSVHDFGYRGVSSEETAVLSGMAHLLNFTGTDNVPAVRGIREFYWDGKKTLIGASVPASEHSVMCSYRTDGELDAFNRLLDLYPTGILSIVSDTYDYYNVLTNILPKLKDKILARDGKVVIRPDSGNPYKILLGDEDSSVPSEHAGTFELLWELFGGTVNTKGYRVLNEKIGVIYGDGMYYDRFADILAGMEDAKFASSNLVIGIGGLLLQNHGRDDLAFALKASAIQVAGQMYSIAKDPKTASNKKSKAGIQRVTETSKFSQQEPLVQSFDLEEPRSYHKNLLDADDSLNALASLLVQQYRYDGTTKRPFINSDGLSIQQLRETVNHSLRNNSYRTKLTQFNRPDWK